MAKRQIKDVQRIDPALLRVLADPVRSFLVYSLVTEAKTAKTLAAELGCPTTRLYYHLQQLEKHDLVFVERTRMVSGILEKHYRASARDLLLDKQAFLEGGKLDRRRSEALLSFVFDQTRVEIGRGLADGRIILGVGIGWQKTEFVLTGQDFHTRGKRADEQLEVMRGLMRGHGRHAPH